MVMTRVFLVVNVFRFESNYIFEKLTRILKPILAENKMLFSILYSRDAESLKKSYRIEIDGLISDMLKIVN